MTLNGDYLEKLSNLMDNKKLDNFYKLIYMTNYEICGYRFYEFLHKYEERDISLQEYSNYQNIMNEYIYEIKKIVYSNRRLEYVKYVDTYINKIVEYTPFKSAYHENTFSLFDIRRTSIKKLRDTFNSYFEFIVNTRKHVEHHSIMLIKIITGNYYDYKYFI